MKGPTEENKKRFREGSMQINMQQMTYINKKLKAIEKNKIRELKK